MTPLTEMPADIVEAAKETLRLINDAPNPRLQIDAIAEAILANRQSSALTERQRCANIAQNYVKSVERGFQQYGFADTPDGRVLKVGHVNAGNSIAEAILKWRV